MRLSASLSLSALIATTLLTGCALTTTATPGIATGASLKGNVHGGQQPVVGSHVYLFAAGTSGYGGPSISLLNSNTDGADSLGSYVLTDANGGFSITGDYACTTGTQVYLLAVGGNPGLPDPQTNPNLALMTNLGQCPASGSFAANIPTVQINEVTTVASVYAISGFMTDLTHVSSSGTALAQTGIANAFATTNNLVDITIGTALNTTPTGSGTVPQSKINALANILAACVNSTGVGSTPCTALFSTAINGTTQPNDTVTAALNIAHNPGTGVAALYGISPTASPFAPSLTTQPNDLTLIIDYNPNVDALDFSTGIAIDALGDVWTSTDTFGITEINGLTGAVISPFNGFTGGGISQPEGSEDLAIDTQGNVWVANPNYNALRNGSLSKFDGATGAAISPSTGYPPNGLSSLYQLTIDTSGNVWVVPQGGYNSVFKFNKDDGTVMPISNTYSNLQPSQSAGPEYAIAADSSGYIWITGGGTITKLDSTTGAVILSNSNYGITSGDAANDIAIDHSGFVWVASNSIEKIDGATGAAVSIPAGYTPGIAIDGLGFVWATAGVSIVKFDGNTGALLTSAVGYEDIAESEKIAIDGSGNVWTTHWPYSAHLTEYVGVAAPVVTPLAAGVANNTLGSRP